MAVTVKNLQADVPYVLDLTAFSPGNYLLDWYEIFECERKDLNKTLVTCNGKRFYQLETETNNILLHSRIRLFDLKQFEVKD